MTAIDWAQVRSTLPQASDYEARVQGHIDITARSRGYRSGDALATYVSSAIPTWNAEAQAFIIWRDSVWVYAHTELAKVLAAERTQPTLADFIAELPAMEWPM